MDRLLNVCEDYERASLLLVVVYLNVNLTDLVNKCLPQKSKQVLFTFSHHLRLIKTLGFLSSESEIITVNENENHEWVIQFISTIRESNLQYQELRVNVDDQPDAGQFKLENGNGTDFDRLLHRKKRQNRRCWFIIVNNKDCYHNKDV